MLFILGYSYWFLIMFIRYVVQNHDGSVFGEPVDVQ